MSAAGDWVSIREFARLDGCSEKLVREAIKRGKLAQSEDKKLDPALAGSPWRRQNRRSAMPADTGADQAEKSARGRLSESEAIEVLKAAGWSEGDDTDFVAGVLAGQFRPAINAEAVKENALAAKHLLAVRRQAGDLVDLELAEAVLFAQARAFRDALINWPSRVGPMIAAELGVPADPVVEALNANVQQLLTDLGEPDAEFAGEQD